ncbi:MAG TPA: orotate phosphoribosyltransferase [Rhizobiales bacterium]|nr:orotate phosphoribosyltransferase [Hyphomicrobiales bacterium]
MTKDELLKEMREAGALLEGHFVLSSGRHSAAYLQCARFLMDAERAGRACAALADKVSAEISSTIDLVFSPAMGGVVVGHEVGRALKRPAIFFERAEGSFALRRGFEIPDGAHCLMVEDVVTTGLSSRECIAAAREHGADVVAGCCLINRSGGRADIGVPLVALAVMDLPTFPADQVPEELQTIPARKPGSRNLK